MCFVNDSYVMDEGLRNVHTSAATSLSILGTIGNVLSIYQIVKKQLYTNCTMLLIADLCVASLVSTLFVLPVIATSNVYGYWAFGQGLCRGFAYLLYVVITSECLLLVNITVGQYLVIIHNINSQRCPVLRLGVLLIVPWAVAMAIYVIPLLHAWDEFGYDPRRGYCTMLNRNSTRSFHSVLSILFISAISLVIVYCYSSIYYVHFRSQRRTMTSVVEAAARFRNRARNKQLIKMISVILLNYGLTYVPYLLVSIVDPCGQTTPLPLYTAVLYVSWTHVATNPVIYALMNNKINATWKHIPCCRNKTTLQKIPGNVKSPDNLATTT